MLDQGRVLDTIGGIYNLGDIERLDKAGLYLFVVKEGANRHDVEALRELLQPLGINALIVVESVFQEARLLSKHDLHGLKDSVEEALGVVMAAERETRVKQPVTATQVVAALALRPGLLDEVYNLLTNLTTRQAPGNGG
jgi:hypothetical protein